MNTLYRYLTLLMICTVIAACNDTSSRAPNNGGMEGGGGNSYNGKPLESYIGDITQTPAYVQKVLPIISTMKKDNEVSTFNVVSVALRKSWYFIPGALQKLPPENIGSAVPTEQVALQNFKEVWLDTTIFNQMNIDEQAKLILHEILMGLRLLKYNSRYEQCMAYAFNFPATCDDSDRRAKSPKDLTAEDYADIRATGSEIWAKPYHDRDTWNDVLARYNFSMSSWIFSPISLRLELSSQELLVSIRTALLTKSFPSFGFSESLINLAEKEKRDSVQSDGRCGFMLTPNVDSDNFVLTDTRSSQRYTFNLPKIQSITKQAIYLNDRVVYSAYVSEKGLKAPGDTRKDIMFIFDQYNKLLGFMPSDSILIDDSNGSDSRYYETQISGSTAMCSNLQSIDFQR